MTNARWLELAAAAGLALGLIPLARHLQYTLTVPAPEFGTVFVRYFLLALLGLPWLLAAGGFVAGLRRPGMGPLAPFLLGTGAMAAGLLGPAKGEVFWPVVLVGLAAFLRARRTPGKPKVYAMIASTGFFITAVGYVAWLLLVLIAEGSRQTAF